MQSDVQTAVQHLTDLSPNPDAFRAQYDKLRMILPSEVGNLVSLLSKIAKNPHISTELSCLRPTYSSENGSRANSNVPPLKLAELRAPNPSRGVNSNLEYSRTSDY